jgi:hypothetical protein
MGLLLLIARSLMMQMWLAVIEWLLLYLVMRAYLKQAAGVHMLV